MFIRVLFVILLITLIPSFNCSFGIGNRFRRFELIINTIFGNNESIIDDSNANTHTDVQTIDDSDRITYQIPESIQIIFLTFFSFSLFLLFIKFVNNNKFQF